MPDDLNDDDLPPLPPGFGGWTAIPLHPEGAPSPLRAVMGDAAYEAQLARQAEQWDISKEHTAAVIRSETAKARLIEVASMALFFIGVTVNGLLLALLWEVLRG